MSRHGTGSLLTALMCHMHVLALKWSFSAYAHLGKMVTLLDGAKCTHFSWEHGLSDVSEFSCGYMLKDMCQTHGVRLTTTAECVTQHSRQLSIDNDLSQKWIHEGILYKMVLVRIGK